MPSVSMSWIRARHGIRPEDHGNAADFRLDAAGGGYREGRAVEWMRPNADHATHARTPYRSRRRGQVRGTAPFSPLRGETVYVHVHVHVHVQGWG
jgi:hypothetical protein